MNILFITIDGLTDPLGQSQIIPYLSGLSDRGYGISILSCEKKKKWRASNQLIQEKLNKKDITWHKVNYSNKIPLLSQWLNVQKLSRKASLLHKKYNYSIIHCRSYIPALVGLELKKKNNVKFIFDMRGFWANERVDGGIWNLKKLVHRKAFNYFKKKEIEFLKNADYVISLTEEAKKEILSWPQLIKTPPPIRVIPCCADLEHFNYQYTKNQLNALKNNLSINDNDFIVSYLGSIGTWYMLDEMLMFFKLLLQTKNNAKFLFITQDTPEIIYKRATEFEIPQSKLIVKAAQRNEVPLLLNITDFSIFFIKPSYSKKASSPTKMAEILGCGIPFITNSGIGDSDRIVKETKSGIMIDEFSHTAYKQAISQMNELTSKEKNFFRSVAMHYFSLEGGVKEYAYVYSKLTNSNS